MLSKHGKANTCPFAQCSSCSPFAVVNVRKILGLVFGATTKPH